MSAYAEYRKAIDSKKAFEIEAKNRAAKIINAGDTELPSNIKITSPENHNGYYINFSMEIRAGYHGDVRIFVEPWDARNHSYKIFLPITDLFAEEA